MKPTQGEVLEAKRFPNAWVYRIHPGFDPDDRVPPEAVVGAWKVDEYGEIIGEFKVNPNYNSEVCNKYLQDI